MLNTTVLVQGTPIPLTYHNRLESKIGAVKVAVANNVRRHPRFDHIVKIYVRAGKNPRNMIYLDIHFCCGCRGPRSSCLGIVLE